MAKNDQKTENFSKKNFLVGIDLEWSKTYFRTKGAILKIFPVEIFFWDNRFFRKIAPAAAAASGAESSFREHASMAKGTYEYDGSKEPQ